MVLPIICYSCFFSVFSGNLIFDVEFFKSGFAFEKGKQLKFVDALAKTNSSPPKKRPGSFPNPSLQRRWSLALRFREDTAQLAFMMMKSPYFNLDW